MTRPANPASPPHDDAAGGGPAGNASPEGDRDALWPFPLRTLDVGPGRVSLVDEGAEGAKPGAPTLVFVHGTPTWSLLYRRFLGALAGRHRVVAWDHLGFGRSERPEGWGYRPADHAAVVARVIDALGLDDVVLVAHDFGGPIGLDWALDHPERVRGLVLFNTWMWSLEGTTAARMGRMLSGRVGRFLYRRNFSPRVLLPAGFADRKRLDPAVYRAYLDAFPDPASRHAPWVFARELAGSGDWYEANWARRERIAELPALLLWGMKDPAFGPAALRRWEGLFERATTVPFADAGHFVQEEAPDEALAALEGWLAELAAGAPGS